MLGQFDYLSTVSGGGYIGSWLTAWRHHAQSDQEVFDGLDRTKSPTGDEAPQIQKLRYNSNYLTPRLGLLSADTWTVVALTIRNLVLNWLVFVPFFMGVLYFPWLCFDLLSAAPGWSASVPLLMPFGIASATAGLAFASYGRCRASGGWLTDGRFVVLVVGPIILAAMAFVTALAGLAERPPALHRGAFAGVASYAVAWLVASAFYRRYRGEHQSRAAQGTCASQVADLVTWIVAGGIAGSILTLGMRLSIELGPDVQDTVADRARHQLDDAVDLRRRADLRWIAELCRSWGYGSRMAGPGIRVAHRRSGQLDRADRSGTVRPSPIVCRHAIRRRLVDGWRTFRRNRTHSGQRCKDRGHRGGWPNFPRSDRERRGRGICRLQVSSIVTGICPHVWPWVVDLGGFALLIAVSAIISWFVNIDRFSLHAVYRNRLMRAFLGSAERHPSRRANRIPSPVLTNPTI